MPPSGPLQSLRAFVVELGPLRWIALTTAVLPTVGLLVLFAHLAEVTAGWPGGAGGALLAVVAIAGATSLVLLPPSFAAFVAGYLFGWWPGSVIAAFGIAAAGWFGQRVVWPSFARGLYPFMRARPRVHAVQAFVTGPSARQVLRVAQLRCAVKFPFAVISLLLSAAAVPGRAVLAGSWLGALPLVALLSGAGATWRRWVEQAVAPSWPELAGLGLAAAAGLATTVVARRALRQVPGI